MGNYTSFHISKFPRDWKQTRQEITILENSFIKALKEQKELDIGSKYDGINFDNGVYEILEKNEKEDKSIVYVISRYDTKTKEMDTVHYWIKIVSYF